ncbi:MAG: LysM peptidoglycan-binding domain-containing protein [Ilumatobacter fluminis]|uniref:CIS tube protein n=1 Tax=Ilumatobacter fluminis TaxID=467091 RepID=UPI0032ECB84D
MSNQLQKAHLETETGERIECMFNPTKFQFKMSNRWDSDRTPGRPAPKLRFGGGEGGTFSLSLVFDTTDTGKAVTDYTQKLLKLLEIDTSLPGYDETRANGRPPWVRFHWGTHLHTFKAVVNSVDVTFTYFSSEGLPLRANVDLSLSQFEPEANWGPQNPTSGTPVPERSHQVQAGETLDRIAARYYADATKWRDIAAANSILDPLDVKPGSVIAIPKLGG